jgi:hypothetical protein
MVQNRETVLLAKRRASITAAMLHPAQGVQLASKKEPVVYYYMPEDKAAAHSSPLKKAGRAEEPFHLLQLAEANSTKLVCTEDNIKALAGTVQAAWSACKADADNYKGAEKWLTPNKDAKRRLFSWVWEPESTTERKTVPPKYGPNHYKLKLSEADRHAKLAKPAKKDQLASALEEQARFARAALDSHHAEATMLAANATKKDFSKCLQEATKDPCQKISGCKDPVCDSYYDDPEIEALCGMCTMAPGAGCFAHSSEVSFLLWTLYEFFLSLHLFSQMDIC